MEASASAPPQRVCPKCGRISWAQGPRCPYCRARFRRQNVALIAWMLAVAVLVTLGGVLAIMLVVGQRVEDRVNSRADRIQRQVDQIRGDIDRRLPPGGVVPTVTPLPTPTPTPTESPSPSPSPSPTGTPTATP
jgi:hypothetical protein